MSADADLMAESVLDSVRAAGTGAGMASAWGTVVQADPLVASVAGARVSAIRATPCGVGDRVLMLVRGTQWVAVAAKAAAAGEVPMTRSSNVIGGEVHAWRQGHVVVVSMWVDVTGDSDDWAAIELATGLPPAVTQCFGTVTRQESNGTSYPLSVDTEGRMTIWCRGTAWGSSHGWAHGGVTYWAT